MTTSGRSFLNRDLLKSPNFVAGTMLMFTVGLIMTGNLALLPTMLQQLMDYPAFTTGRGDRAARLRRHDRDVYGRRASSTASTTG